MMLIAIPNLHICVRQQGNRDYLTKFEKQRLETPPEKHMP